jgi:hypothetical protein
MASAVRRLVPRRCRVFRGAAAAAPYSAGVAGPSRVPWSRLLVGVAGASGVLAAVLSDAYLLAGPLGSRLSAVNSFVSELEVPGQPTSAVLRLVDTAAGLLIVILAVGLLYDLAREPYAIAGALFLAMSGLASVADAAYPMTCTPSTDPLCRRAIDNLSPLAQLHQRHTVSSVIAVFGVVMAMLLLSRAPTVRAWSPWLGAASAGAGILVSMLNVAELPLIALGRWMGTLERGHLLLISAWITAVAGYLLRDAVRRAPPPRNEAIRRALSPPR